MSIEFKVDVSLKIECVKCGEDLDAVIGGKYRYSEDTIKVTPCKVCMESATEAGRQEAEGGAA